MHPFSDCIEIGQKKFTTVIVHTQSFYILEQRLVGKPNLQAK
jgi:hypothetical protein